METIKKRLEEFIELLEKEKEILIKSTKEYSVAQALDQIRTQKEQIINELSQNPQELQKYREHLEKIQTLSQINMELASNSMQFVQKLFEAIFEDETATVYGKDGEIATNKRTILNKKA